MSKKKKKKKKPVAAQPPPPPREAAKKEPPGLGKWIVLREHLEAIAGVIIVILVLRHFCLGNYQIPTSSMEPTLFGNHPSEGIRGDRILVDRLSYLLGEPKRWDTIVFKFPLDRSKTFIKRLIGLPGEEIRIHGGNIWVNREPGGFPASWFLARKPRAVQQEVWQVFYPECRDETPGTWGPEGEATFEGRPEDGVLTAPAGGEGWLEYRGRIQARVPRPHPPYESPFMGEIRLAFRGRLEGGGLAVDLDLGGQRIRYELPADGGQASIVLDGVRVAEGASPVREGDGHYLAFENVDGVLAIEVDGETVLSHEYDLGAIPGQPSRPPSRPRLRLGVTKGGILRLSGMRMYRDIHYVEDGRGILRREGSLRVPPDSFFVLGDNCTRSKDSRLWRSVTYRTKDGVEVLGEFEGEEYTRDDIAGEIEFLDVKGSNWRFGRDGLVNFDETPVHSPFVDRRFLLGKAFMVYWPLTRFRLIPGG
jgi:signal peptidase I